MTKVMLVDDDASMQVLIEQIVRRGGYDFCCAGNGTDGLEMLRAERPDFLILDVMLPDTNGFEICETVRGEGRKVPIMFLTAKGDIVDKCIGFKAGADDYLVKPFQPEELLAAPAGAPAAAGAGPRAAARRAGGPAALRGGSFKVGDLESPCSASTRCGCVARSVAAVFARVRAAGAAGVRPGRRVHARPDPGARCGADKAAADP